MRRPRRTIKPVRRSLAQSQTGYFDKLISDVGSELSAEIWRSQEVIRNDSNLSLSIINVLGNLEGLDEIIASTLPATISLPSHKDIFIDGTPANRHIQRLNVNGTLTNSVSLADFAFDVSEGALPIYAYICSNNSNTYGSIFFIQRQQNSNLPPLTLAYFAEVVQEHNLIITANSRNNLINFTYTQIDAGASQLPQGPLFAYSKNLFVPQDNNLLGLKSGYIIYDDLYNRYYISLSLNFFIRCSIA